MHYAKLRGALYAQQVRSTFVHLPLTLSVSVLNSALVGFVLFSATSAARMIVWFGLLAGLSALRFFLWYAFRHPEVELNHKQWRTHLHTGGTLASGVLWGSSVLLFSPLSDPQLLFLTLVIAGMCAGAATVHAAHFPSVAAFILPAVIPVIIAFLTKSDKLQVVSGIMAGVFGLSLCLASLQFRKWFRETTAARLISSRQKSEISKAKARLIADLRMFSLPVETLLRFQIWQMPAGVSLTGCLM